MQNIEWIFGDYPEPDFRVYKEENLPNGLVSLRRLRNECQKRFGKVPYLNLNGEAQTNSRIAHMIADPSRTFSVAPGTRFRRLFFPISWADPQTETWGERQDCICWIGRPLPERIRLAKKINAMGIGLDIYSRDSWPLPNWKGFAPDEIETSRKYQYRIVCENSLKDLYHSEKLINSIRSGCATFYISDPELSLPHLEGAYIPFSEDSLMNRDEISEDILHRMHTVMFSDAWEVYSFRSFFDTIIDFARKAVQNKKDS